MNHEIHELCMSQIAKIDDVQNLAQNLKKSKKCNSHISFYYVAVAGLSANQKRFQWFYLILTLINIMCIISAILYTVNCNQYYLPANKFEMYDWGPDYALHSAGARVIDTPYTESYPEVTGQIRFFSFAYSLWNIGTDRKGPDSVLRDWKSPGECWAFKGHKGSVVIRLSHAIVPKGVSLEHVSSAMSPSRNIDSAPRDFSVYAIDDDRRTHLGQFEYKQNNTATQSFRLVAADPYPIKTMEFEFHSNHGHKYYTCVYKVRVHGDLGN